MDESQEELDQDDIEGVAVQVPSEVKGGPHTPH